MQVANTKIICFRNICCLGICKDFYQRRKYNLVELAKPPHVRTVGSENVLQSHKVEPQDSVPEPSPAAEVDIPIEKVEAEPSPAVEVDIATEKMESEPSPAAAGDIPTEKAEPEPRPAVEVDIPTEKV